MEITEGRFAGREWSVNWLLSVSVPSGGVGGIAGKPCVDARKPGAVCSKMIDYGVAISRTSRSTSSIRPTPHGIHSWQCISGTLPSFGIVRVNCIGSVQHGQLGASGNSSVGISARRQNNGIAPNRPQNDPADESTGQPLPKSEMALLVALGALRLPACSVPLPYE